MNIEPNIIRITTKFNEIELDDCLVSLSTLVEVKYNKCCKRRKRNNKKMKDDHNDDHAD